jgi:predicted dehydrogenase
MKSMVAGGAAVAVVAPAVYYGYQSMHGKPVKAALIGTGDEGGVLAGAHNPEYLELIAVCDIRPSNLRRIFEGDKGGAAADRPGLDKIYGGAASGVKKYTDYKQMLDSEKDLEAVVIALPLHLHAKAAIDAMRAGQRRGKPIHVLCEKLMAWNVRQCKKMIEVAEETGSILSIGHQRHYSMLYAHATEILKAGVLGDVKHIRALWHRNNSWPFQPSPEDRERMVEAAGVVQPYYKDGWFNPIFKEDYNALNGKLDPEQFNDVEQLIRWRLYDETGGGLMAELGSHQLDACGIFLGHVHPLAVTAVGGKFFYGPGRNDRQAEDHVFVTYEYPGKEHPKGPKRADGSHGTDESDVVVVTYSSVSTNQFEAYGECVVGSRGTMIVEREGTLMLYPEKDPRSTAKEPTKALTVGVSATGQGKPALEASASGGPPTAASPTGTPAAGPVSRGYREEMEDFAYCVRLWDPKIGYEKEGENYKQRLPRCHGEVAMADAIVALTANHAMRKKERIPFQEAWFDPKSKETPDGDAKPKIDVESA